MDNIEQLTSNLTKNDYLIKAKTLILSQDNLSYETSILKKYLDKLIPISFPQGIIYTGSDDILAVEGELASGLLEDMIDLSYIRNHGSKLKRKKVRGIEDGIKETICDFLNKNSDVYVKTYEGKDGNPIILFAKSSLDKQLSYH